jgi:hypothetical protein
LELNFLDAKQIMFGDEASRIVLFERMLVFDELPDLICNQRIEVTQLLSDFILPLQNKCSLLLFFLSLLLSANNLVFSLLGLKSPHLGFPNFLELEVTQGLPLSGHFFLLLLLLIETAHHLGEVLVSPNFSLIQLIVDVKL